MLLYLDLYNHGHSTWPARRAEMLKNGLTVAGGGFLTITPLSNSCLVWESNYMPRPQAVGGYTLFIPTLAGTLFELPP